jgi:hypothetical protein
MINIRSLPGARSNAARYPPPTHETSTSQNKMHLHSTSSFLTNDRRSRVVLASILTSAALLHNAVADDIKLLDKKISGVPAAKPEVIPDNTFSPEFTTSLVVEGIDFLENPSGLITQFGYLSDGSRTEPAENTYLVLDHNPGGPVPGYDYGRHFLFQGHAVTGNLAYITRVNLDVAHPDYRITLLTPVDAGSGLTGFNIIDGSSWDPFSKSLLFAQESVTDGGIIGRASYEDIRSDDLANLLIIEDVNFPDVVNFAKNLERVINFLRSH